MLSVLTCIDSGVCCSSLVAGSLRFSYCRQGQIYGISGFCLPGCHVRMCAMHKLAVGIHAPVVGLGAVSACFMCTCASVWFASRSARVDFRCASHDVGVLKTWWNIRSPSTCRHGPKSPHAPLCLMACWVDGELSPLNELSSLPVQLRLPFLLKGRPVHPRR